MAPTLWTWFCLLQVRVNLMTIFNISQVWDVHYDSPYVSLPPSCVSEYKPCVCANWWGCALCPAFPHCRFISSHNVLSWRGVDSYCVAAMPILHECDCLESNAEDRHNMDLLALQVRVTYT